MSTHRVGFVAVTFACLAWLPAAAHAQSASAIAGAWSGTPRAPLCRA